MYTVLAQDMAGTTVRGIFDKRAILDKNIDGIIRSINPPTYVSIVKGQANVILHGGQKLSEFFVANGERHD